MADIVGTLRRGEGGERWPHRRPQAGHRTRDDRAQVGFEFGKDLLDGIEVGAVGRQIEQLRPDGFNRLTDPGHFMTGQIVQDDIVARAERGGQDLFDVGHEARAIDRAALTSGRSCSAAYRTFFTGRPRRRTARQTGVRLTDTPKAVRNSASVASGCAPRPVRVE